MTMNTDFRSILSSHARRYPLTRPTDLLKLIHQNVFGSGHLAPSPEIVRERLADEFASCDKTEPFVETLGECSRVYIGSAVPATAADAAAADSSGSRGIINKIAGFEHRPADERLLEIIARLFILTADRFPCDYAHADESSRLQLNECINTAREVVRDGCFGFGIDEFDSAVADFAAAGYPAQSHSDAYRNAYRPAYRVVDSYFARLIPCLYAISRLLDEKSGQVRVVIDGRAASGKTTAAELIAGYFSTTYTCAYTCAYPSTHPDAYPRVCPDTRSVTTDIIHTDDFFLPPSLRTPERLDEVGGNLHRERFYDEIIANLDSSDGFSYRVFDCSKMDYAPEPRKLKPCRLLIFEGAYSLHPDFGDYYDLAIFSDISPDEQRLRILSRNGERMLKRFEQEWIPMEEKYFDGFDIRQKCKITI